MKQIFARPLVFWASLAYLLAGYLYLVNADLVRVIRVTSNSSNQSPLSQSSSSLNNLSTSPQSNNFNNSFNSVNSELGESLASLTLHQIRAPSQGGPSSGSNNKKSSNRNLQDGRRPRRFEPVEHTNENWLELNMERVRPSWLRVGRQFKITPKSIDEVQHGRANWVAPDFVLRPAFDSPILLRTKMGILEGVRSLRFNKFLYIFLSIPYASPPLGDLRFRAPKKPEPWQGIYQATKWPPFCVQPSMTLASKSSPVHVMTDIMTEDCLYLNVWSPSLKVRHRNKLRPVMVWLHGGAFQYGGVSVDENEGSALALFGDVVVVTLNYRISAFGFLNANNLNNAPNNVGLLDQRAALEWVRDNIASFGGDPQQVTLFGESAGGHSVGLHLISPPSWPLFKRAIFQSGVPTSMLRSYDVNPDNDGPMIGEGAIMVAKRLQCYNESSSSNDNPQSSSSSSNQQNNSNAILNDATIECLRQRSSLEILKAMGMPGTSGFFPTGDDQNGFFPNGPITESFDPSNLRIGPQRDFLMGTNTDEGTFMLHYGMPSIFPARDLPRVHSMEQLHSLLIEEMSSIPSTTSESSNINSSSISSSSELESASGERAAGAQAHLIKPLLRLKSSLLERFINRVRTSNNLQDQLQTQDNNINSQQQQQQQDKEKDDESNKRMSFGQNVGSLVSDIIFLCPTRSLARTFVEANRNVYFYLFGHRSSASQYHPWMGVTHHDEVEFIFGRPLRMADIYSGSDIDISKRLIKTWAQFARTGKPAPQLGVSWPKYDVDENSYMYLQSNSLIGNSSIVGRRYHESFCNLYDTVISVHLQD